MVSGGLEDTSPMYHTRTGEARRNDEGDEDTLYSGQTPRTDGFDTFDDVERWRS